MCLPTQNEYAEQMRIGLTNLAQFRAVGSYHAVADKYGVSKSTALKWMKILYQTARVEQETPEGTGTDMCKLKGRELGQWCYRMGYACNDCGLKCDNNRTTGYDLLSVCETKELQHDKELDKILVTYSDEEIERQWQHVESSLKIIRNMNVERANMKFWSRFEMVTKGMR